MATKWKQHNIKLGETLMLKPSVCLDKLGKTQRSPIPGTIVYINRKHNYFTAEFNFPTGSFKESFKFYAKDDLACAMQSQ